MKMHGEQKKVHEIRERFKPSPSLMSLAAGVLLSFSQASQAQAQERPNEQDLVESPIPFQDISSHDQDLEVEEYHERDRFFQRLSDARRATLRHPIETTQERRRMIRFCTDDDQTAQQSALEEIRAMVLPSDDQHSLRVGFTRCIFTETHTTESGQEIRDRKIATMITELDEEPMVNTESIPENTIMIAIGTGETPREAEDNALLNGLLFSPLLPDRREITPLIAQPETSYYGVGFVDHFALDGQASLQLTPATEVHDNDESPRFLASVSIAGLRPSLENESTTLEDQSFLGTDTILSLEESLRENRIELDPLTRQRAQELLLIGASREDLAEILPYSSSSFRLSAEQLRVARMNTRDHIQYFATTDTPILRMDDFGLLFPLGIENEGPNFRMYSASHADYQYQLGFNQQRVQQWFIAERVVLPVENRVLGSVPAFQLIIHQRGLQSTAECPGGNCLDSLDALEHSPTVITYQNRFIEDGSYRQPGSEITSNEVLTTFYLNLDPFKVHDLLPIQGEGIGSTPEEARITALRNLLFQTSLNDPNERLRIGHALNTMGIVDRDTLEYTNFGDFTNEYAFESIRFSDEVRLPNGLYQVHAHGSRIVSPLMNPMSLVEQAVQEDTMLYRYTADRSNQRRNLGVVDNLYLNDTFMNDVEKNNVFVERCMAMGICSLEIFAGHSQVRPALGELTSYQRRRVFSRGNRITQVLEYLNGEVNPLAGQF